MLILRILMLIIRRIFPLRLLNLRRGCRCRYKYAFSWIKIGYVRLFKCDYYSEWVCDCWCGPFILTSFSYLLFKYFSLKTSEWRWLMKTTRDNATMYNTHTYTQTARSNFNWIGKHVALSIAYHFSICQLNVVAHFFGAPQKKKRRRIGHRNHVDIQICFFNCATWDRQSCSMQYLFISHRSIFGHYFRVCVNVECAHATICRSAKWTFLLW